MAGAGLRPELGVGNTIQASYMGSRTQLLEPSLLPPGLALAGSWSAELEAGIGPRRPDSES